MDICPFPHAQISTFLLKLRMHVNEINKPAPMKLACRDFCCKDNSFFRFLTWTASHVHSWITVKYGLNWNDFQTCCCTSFPARIALHISTKEYWDVSQRRVDVFMVSEMKINLGIYIAICRSFLFILAFLCNYCVL